jgi:hypothetical protein
VKFIFFCILALVAEANVGGHVRGVYLSPEKVAEDSQAVAKVSIQRVAPVVIEGRVWTEAHCLVQEVWQGELGATMIVRQAGGSTPELRTEAGPRPDFKAGQEWILAVVAPPFGDWTLLGLNQGAWVISGGNAVRDYGGFSFIEPPPVEIAEGRFERVPVVELQQEMAEPELLAAINQPDPTDPPAPQVNPPSPVTTAAGMTTPEPKSTLPAPAAETSAPAPFPWAIVLLLIIIVFAFIIFRRSRS